MCDNNIIILIKLCDIMIYINEVYIWNLLCGYWCHVTVEWVMPDGLVVMCVLRYDWETFVKQTARCVLRYDWETFVEQTAICVVCGG